MKDLNEILQILDETNDTDSINQLDISKKKKLMEAIAKGIQEHNDKDDSDENSMDNFENLAKKWASIANIVETCLINYTMVSLWSNSKSF